mgnify:CR=1 FL=1
MANAVPADASSSASVNPTLIAVEHTSSDAVKLILSGDISIVSRFCYFDEPLAIEELPLPLTETQTENLYQASRRFLAEKQAAVYLNRAEHSSYQLTVKLQKKGYIKNEYQPALDYLRAEGTLDDSRFAGAYLHTRSLSKKEGYARLFRNCVSAESLRTRLGKRSMIFLRRLTKQNYAQEQCAALSARAIPTKNSTARFNGKGSRSL